MKWFASKVVAGAAVAAIFSGSVSAQSYLGDQGYLETQRGTSYAGLYLSVPIGSGYTAKQDDLKFGFRAGFRYDRRWNNHSIVRTSSLSANMVTLDFTSRGFKQLSLAGMPMIYTDQYGRTIFLDDSKNDEEEGGIGVGTILLWTGGILGGLILVGLAETCLDGEPEGRFDYRCPL